MPASIRSLPPLSKKRKPNPSSTLHSIATRIQSLESTLTSAVQSSSSLNPLADLLDLAQTATEAQDASKAIYALYRVFVVLVGSGKMSAELGGEEAKVVRVWLWERLGAYGGLLVGLMKDEDAGLRVRIHLLYICCCTDSLGRYLLSKFYSHFKNTFRPRSHLLPLMRNHNFIYPISKRFSPVYSYVHHLHATTRVNDQAGTAG